MKRPSLLDFTIATIEPVLSRWRIVPADWLCEDGWRNALAVLVYGTARYVEEWHYWQEERIVG